MSKYDKNLGKTFGQLTCIEHAELDNNPPSMSKYIFQCECGELRIARFDRVGSKSGRVSACSVCMQLINAASKTTHGQANSPLYICWRSMKYRCKYYPTYKDRKYDPRWEKFEAFKEDMGESFFDGATLDRIDNNGDYCKENCQWLSKTDHGRKSIAERNS